jgi:hypothetical protein
MPSSDEIRSAMYRAENDGPIYGSDADTLAACVRELYEALHDARDSLTTFTLDTGPEDFVLDRYRAALEGGKHANN